MAHGNIEIATKRINRFDIYPCRSLLIEQCDRIPVEPRIPRNIADLELSLPHQLRQVALDHDMLRVNISFIKTKKCFLMMFKLS